MLCSFCSSDCRSFGVLPFEQQHPIRRPKRRERLVGILVLSPALSQVNNFLRKKIIGIPFPYNSPFVNNLSYKVVTNIVVSVQFIMQRLPAVPQLVGQVYQSQSSPKELDAAQMLLVGRATEGASASDKKKYQDKVIAQHEALIWRVRMAVFLNTVAWQIMLPATPAMMIQVAGGNTVAAEEVLTYLGAVASAIQFLITPALGRLSDRIGRQPVLILCPILCAFIRTSFFLVGTGKTLDMSSVVMSAVADRIVAGALFQWFFTVLKAVLVDVYAGHGEALARVYGSTISAPYGLGLLLGPYFGTQLQRITTKPRHSALVAAVVSVVQSHTTNNKNVTQSYRTCHMGHVIWDISYGTCHMGYII